VRRHKLKKLACAVFVKEKKRGKMPRYKITISFESDYELEQHQVDDLLGHLELQIQEPQTYKGEDEIYTTQNIEIRLEENQ
jgi:hypothetical protein